MRAAVVVQGSRTPRRDPATERAFLNQSQLYARLTVASWPTAVERRLQLGEERYGEQWSARPTGALLTEAAEEALDLCSWSALALQSLAAGVDPDAAATVEKMLARAAGAAAEAYGYLTAAQGALRKAAP